MKKQSLMYRGTAWLATLVCAALLAAGPARAHCEIPCGIYGDQMRCDLLREHFQTVEKSMVEIEKLAKQGDKNYNQLVRWVTNKDLHANKIQDIVYQYFMNQRVSPVKAGNKGYDDYVTQITLLHNLLVSAMKCKQTTDVQHVEDLRKTLDAFEKAYFGEAAEGHRHKH